jgi:bacillithiol biosynthesis cysteine-adding enzyme BshC
MARDRDILSAYLAGEAGAFFPTPWREPGARAEVVARVSRPLDPVVAAALGAQQARLPGSRARDQQLAALSAGAAAVVTGQQVGLFLGPLYTLYKAASAIRVAAQLSAETGKPVVPVFWLQSEDHDLPEIASCGLCTREGEPRILSLPAAPEDRVSIAHRVLPAELEACLAELRAGLAGHVLAGDHLALVERHYRPGAGWVGSFAGLLAELFAPEGLVVVDPRDPALAEAARPVHQRALVEREKISAALIARTVALATAGFTAPVHVRSGAPLFFFHPEGPEGPRYRLEPAAGGRFRVVGGPGMFSVDDLQDALVSEPRCFSTSALLRPILQDTWLPSAAYLGGPGEIAYFAQLAPLYQLFGRPMPMILPRARFRLLEARTRKLLDRLGVGPADAALGEDALLARCRRRPGPDEAEGLGKRLRDGFDALLAEVGPALAATGQDGEKTLLETRASVGRRIDKLTSRHREALLRKDRERLAEVRRLKALLHPGDAPQERVLGLPYFAARFGERVLLDKVLDAIDPFVPAVKDLSL